MECQLRGLKNTTCMSVEFATLKKKSRDEIELHVSTSRPELT